MAIDNIAKISRVYASGEIRAAVRKSRIECSYLYLWTFRMGTRKLMHPVWHDAAPARWLETGM